ncbi:hypothetical protein AB4114_18310 [Paenibacillus sp. 2RAB27]|uniref:hypothetical protein n=1 Tax=Paenibacillus sp. 2RAB27 TaxID=3232991 RepID=UPI003F9BD054
MDLMALSTNANIPPANTDVSRIKAYTQTTSVPATFVFTGDDITHAPGKARLYRNYMQHFEEKNTLGNDRRCAGTSEAIRWQNFVFNTGMKGITAAELLVDFNRLVTGLKPETVFVMLGMANAVKRTSIDDFKIDMKALAVEIRKIGAVPVFETVIYPTDSDFMTKIPAAC